MCIFMKRAKITWIVLRGKSEIAYWKGFFENCIYELPVIVAVSEKQSMLYGMLCNTVRIFIPLLYCYMFA